MFDCPHSNEHNGKNNIFPTRRGLRLGNLREGDLDLEGGNVSLPRSDHKLGSRGLKGLGKNQTPILCIAINDQGSFHPKEFK